MFTYNVFNEEHPVAEPQREFVEELDILEQVVIAGPGVAVLVVVPVDQQLDHGLHVVGGDQSLLLPRACDEGNSTDGYDVTPGVACGADQVFTLAAQLLDAVVLGFGQQLLQLSSRVGQGYCAVP